METPELNQQQFNQIPTPPSNQQQHKLPTPPSNQQQYKLQQLPTLLPNQQYYQQQNQLPTPPLNQYQHHQHKVPTLPSNQRQYNLVSTPTSNYQQHHQQQQQLHTPPSNQQQHPLATPPSNQQQPQTLFSTPVQVDNVQYQQHFQHNEDFMARHYNSAPPSTSNHINSGNRLRASAHLNQLDLSGSMNNSDSLTNPRNCHRINRSLSFSEDLLSTVGTPSLMDSNSLLTTTQDINTSTLIQQVPVNSGNCNSTDQVKTTVLNTSATGGGSMSFSRESTSGGNTSNLSVSRENTSGDGFPLPVNILLNDLPMPETLPNLTFSPSKPLHETSFSEVKQFLKTPQKVKAMREEERKMKEAARSNSNCSSPLDGNKQTGAAIPRTPQKLQTLKEESSEETNRAPLNFTSTPEKKVLQQNREGNVLVPKPDNNEAKFGDDNDHEISYSSPDSPMGESFVSPMPSHQGIQSHQPQVTISKTATTLALSSSSTSFYSIKNDCNTISSSSQNKLTSQTVSSTKNMVVTHNNPLIPPSSSNNFSTTISSLKPQEKLPNLQTITTISAKPFATNITNSASVKKAVVIVEDVFMQDGTAEPSKVKDFPPSVGSHHFLSNESFAIDQDQQVEPSVKQQIVLSTQNQHTSGMVSLPQIRTCQGTSTGQTTHPSIIALQTTPTRNFQTPIIKANDKTTSPPFMNQTIVTPTRSTTSSLDEDIHQNAGFALLTRVMNRKDSVESENGNSLPSVDDPMQKKHESVGQSSTASAHPTTPTTRNSKATTPSASPLPSSPPLVTTKNSHTTNASRKDNSSSNSPGNCHITQTSTGGNNRKTKQQQSQQEHCQDKHQTATTTTFDYEQRLKERAADFANIYFNRVHKVLVDNSHEGGTELAIQFFTLMRSANQRSMSKLETYHQVATLLADYPELVDSFVGFLDQHEARHVGKVS